MEGFLLIDKPSGMTSHDVVDQIRKLTGIQKVGHAGTLDPFATGLLLVGVGRAATREMSKLVGLDKSYEAVFRLGARSTTDDREGDITKTDDATDDEETIVDAIRPLVGEIKQRPPAFAAIKVKGQKLYEAARKGEVLEVEPRDVRVDRFVVTTPPTRRDDGLVEFPVEIDCSSGTYIRALARDLGENLGTGGYVQELRRTAIGPFLIKEATPLDALTPETITENLRSIDTTLSEI